MNYMHEKMYSSITYFYNLISQDLSLNYGDSMKCTEIFLVLNLQPLVRQLSVLLSPTTWMSEVHLE